MQLLMQTPVNFCLFKAAQRNVYVMCVSTTLSQTRKCKERSGHHRFPSVKAIPSPPPRRGAAPGPVKRINSTPGDRAPACLNAIQAGRNVYNETIDDILHALQNTTLRRYLQYELAVQRMATLAAILHRQDTLPKGETRGRSLLLPRPDGVAFFRTAHAPAPGQAAGFKRHQRLQLAHVAGEGVAGQA